MDKIKINGLDQEIHIEKLNDGLTVYLIPFKNRKNYYIEYVAKFGSTINKFKKKDEEDYITVPYGVAHFLEHKMFEQEEGLTPFSFFSQYGSDANASTGYKSTSYLVEGTNHIRENLDYLLTYVNSPYFTDENVEKEKNIIIEEINMYKDEPESRLYEESNKAIFKIHPIRVDIGGTEESVRSITKEDLYNCYNAFYQPSNMCLFVGGNFDEEEVLDTIKKNKALMNNKIHQEIDIKTEKEQDEVNEKFKEVKIPNMVIPKLILTIKVPLKNMSKNKKIKTSLISNLILGILYGNSSEFRENMLKNGYMSALVTSKAIIDDFLLIEFIAESKKPRELGEEIKKCFKESKIAEEELTRHKKVYISCNVLNSDKVIPTVNSIIANVMDYGNVICDKIDIIRSIKLKDLEDVKEKIDIENSSLVIAYPNE